jgi:phosphomannomutase
MAEWNSCSSLLNNENFKEAIQKYDEILLNGEDPFNYMLKMQFDLQVALSNKGKHNPSPDSLITIGQKFDWLRENKQAFDDEYREIIDALPGIKTPEKDRSALWKKWKAKYDSLRSEEISSLSHEDRLELMFEVIDAAHFFNNVLLALGVDAETYFTLYYLKNAENIARQKRGY